LSIEPLRKFEVLEYGEVHVLEAGVTKDVARHGTKVAQCIRNQGRVPLHVAAARSQCIEVGRGRRTLGPHRGGIGCRREGLNAGDSAGYTATAKARARAVGNGTRGGFEVGGVANEIPTVGVFERPAEIVRAVDDIPRLRACQGHDGVELPAFQQLAEAFLSGKLVTGRDRSAMADIEIAVAEFRQWIRGVLRLAAEAVERTVVEAMTI